MAISYREKVRRCLMINGAYFHSHVTERAEERLGLSDFPSKKFEKKIINLDGDLYYDREYGNYQLVLDDLAFAFDLQLHENRPGLLAFVKTTVTQNNEFRGDDDRYQQLDPEDFHSCPECEPALKKILEEHLPARGR